MYALGWTQHSKGSQNIRCMAMLQLILGNIGVRGGGMNALRGHSNIQGLTDLGLMSNLIPGYLTLADRSGAGLRLLHRQARLQAERPGQMSYWQNYKKFFVSFQKSMYGPAATAENDFAYDYLPKLDVPAYDVLRAFELMHQGKMNGYICQGFNPLLSVPESRARCRRRCRSSSSWSHGSAADGDGALLGEPRRVQRGRSPRRSRPTVFELPSTCFAEDEGSLTNSGRWLQWHWAGGTPPGEAKSDVWIMAQLYMRLKALYQKEGGNVPRADPQPALALQGPGRPDAGRDRQGDQRLRRVDDVPDPADPTKLVLQKGKQVVSFAALRDDGSTACGCWIYSGCFNEAGNNMARRDNTDPDEHRRLCQVGVLVAGQPPHPLQSRLGRHAGQAVGSQAQAASSGTARSGPATTCPTSCRPRSRTWSVPSS